MTQHEKELKEFLLSTRLLKETAEQEGEISEGREEREKDGIEREKEGEEGGKEGNVSGGYEVDVDVRGKVSSFNYTRPPLIRPPKVIHTQTLTQMRTHTLTHTLELHLRRQIRIDIENLCFFFSYFAEQIGDVLEFQITELDPLPVVSVKVSRVSVIRISIPHLSSLSSFHFQNLI